MGIENLSQQDFSFYRAYADKMVACHEREFLEEINPEIIRALYRGNKNKDNRFSRFTQVTGKDHQITLNTLFSSSNTRLPNLYFQNPNPIITPIKDSTPESAAILTSLIKHYMKENSAKRENQEAVLNADWFGLGWKKQGYRVSMGLSPDLEGEPESQGNQGGEKPFNFMDVLFQKEEPDALQYKPRVDFVEEEGLFNSSESPLNVMVDHKSDLLNSKAILHRLPRTLYEIMNFGSYDQESLDEIYQKYRHVRGTRMESRDIDLTLMELHVRQRNGIWILTWIDEFHKPLQYEKSTWQGKGFQFTPLSFTNEPGVRYPVSNMKIGAENQKNLDKMASTWYEHVSRARNILFVNEHDLAKGQLEAITENRIQMIVVTNKAVNAGTFAHASSPAIQSDIIQLINLMKQNLIEVIGSDSQAVSGQSVNKTLGQDELARTGTKVRESGAQDKVRDWMIEQIEKEAKLLQQYSNAELRITINPEDFADVSMRDGVQERQMQFMTPENPIGAKSVIQGEFKYDVNIEEAIRPDNEAIRREIERIIATYSNPLIKSEVNNDGFVLSVSGLFKKWLSTFEVLGNPDKFLPQIDPSQLAAMQVKELLMNNRSMGAPVSAGSSQSPIKSPIKSNGSKVGSETEREPSSSMVAA